MSIHNKKTARLLQGVALGLIIISATLFLGCENPVGGIEQKPIEELVGKKYKDTYGTLFSISKEGTDILVSITSTYDNTQGKIISSKNTTEGTVYLLECSSHINTAGYQYPNYDEHDSHECIKDSYGSCSVPHKDCYTLVYVRSSSTQSVEWAAFYTSVDTKKTACFDFNSDSKAKEYLDFNKWDPLTFGCSEGIAQN